eukprot:TRINITY_DN3734_c0_g1_i2.p1 TRINITY_DN3734_c0_g1~~TRINITY_DN3734_c0_g1_i2.p1  ORF type:complete len:868 (-),score=163.94 TRINITY_DN3734_c0_g1_i2:474-3077(-)
MLSDRLQNVTQLLAWREISSRVKRSTKRLWGDTARSCNHSFCHRCEVTDAKSALITWVESESLKHFSAKYCPLVPPPRSTIAAAFSPDGQTLASTHGDHTVKIICCKTGSCLKVLSGHRRTPWVVRFHPTCPEILASGSLDHEVRLWNARTAECIGSRDFYRPIASIAFHAEGDLLAVASGHKLYIWQYNKRGGETPSIVLRTRRSLRAVHFHPHGAPLLLTAEVNDLDPSDSRMTLATTPGYLQYPPAILFTQMHSNAEPGNSVLGVNSPSLMHLPCLFWPAFVTENNIPSTQADAMAVENASARSVGNDTFPSSQFLDQSSMLSQSMAWATPMDVSDGMTQGGLGSEFSSFDRNERRVTSRQMTLSEATDYEPYVDRHEVIDEDISMIDRPSNFPLHEPEDVAVPDENIASRRNQPGSTSYQGQGSLGVSYMHGTQLNIPVHGILSSNIPANLNLQFLLRNGSSTHTQQVHPMGDHSGWEIPFLQGWLMGQTHAGLAPNLPFVEGSQGGIFEHPATQSDTWTSELHRQQQNHGGSFSSSATSNAAGLRISGRHGGRPRTRSRTTVHISTNSLGTSAANTVSSSGDAGADAVDEARSRRVNLDTTETETAAAHASMAAAAAAAAAAELPCTVKLRVWPHNINDPCALLDPERCRLTIPHAVLCSEMGAHFSPCGRFLAACVACLLPQQEPDGPLYPNINHDTSGLATSPTRHSIPAQQVVYELRIYSLEEETFGEVLASRAIRAAHCLTSIQFSPTSAHILLAYGRRHTSLLRSVVIDGKNTIPIYTILEIYKVSNMELVQVLPSAEDEVNVACFHPEVGGGLVYGTKEGKLRIFQHDSAQVSSYSRNLSGVEHNMFEVQTVALEC